MALVNEERWAQKDVPTLQFSFQSGKARAGKKGHRLALFDVSSICQVGYLSRELG